MKLWKKKKWINKFFKSLALLRVRINRPWNLGSQWHRPCLFLSPNPNILPISWQACGTSLTLCWVGTVPSASLVRFLSPRHSNHGCWGQDLDSRCFDPNVGVLIPTPEYTPAAQSHFPLLPITHPPSSSIHVFLMLSFCSCCSLCKNAPQ